MGRRSDHSRDEPARSMIDAGAVPTNGKGFAAFSAHEAAKCAGYTIGTVHDVSGNGDGLVTTVNTRAFADKVDVPATCLTDAGDDRIAAPSRLSLADICAGR